MSCGSGSSRYCRRSSGGFAIRVASGFVTGGRCRGSCLCCTRGSRGGICRSSLVSVAARPATAASMSGSVLASGSGCTRSCCRSCALQARSSGHAQLRTRVTCKRKGGLRGPARARLIEPETAPSTHLLVDATGIPLAWTVTGGNRNDVTQLVALVERVPPVRGEVAVAHVGGPSRCSPPIAAMTTTNTAASSADEASAQKSRAAKPGTALVSAATAGSSSALSLGCTSSSGCSSATTAGTRSTKLSSRSAVASSASGESITHSDSSS